MDKLLAIKRTLMQTKNQNIASNLIRCGSSSLNKRGIQSNVKPLSLFPSDFFSSGDEGTNQSQKVNTLNQPILINSPNINLFPPRVNQPKNIQSKVIIDFQKEFDEDKELLQLLQGETNPRSYSEESLRKPFSSGPKRLSKKLVECEIIPEVDEDKMRTSTKIFFEDNDANKNNNNGDNYNYNYNTYNNNLNISPQKMKTIKAIEKNNESLSTTNVTYDSMKPKSKMKRRYHSGDSKTAKMSIIAVNYKNTDNTNSTLKQLVLPTIKKQNPYTELQKKFENLFDNLGEFSEEEHIKPQLNQKMQNINDIKSVLMKKSIQREKMGSTNQGEINYLKKSPSSSNIPNINKTKMSLNNNYQQLHSKITRKNPTYLNGGHHNKTRSLNSINVSKVNQSSNKCEIKKDANSKLINYKIQQLPVKVIPK